MVTPTASQVKGEYMRKILLVLVAVLLLANAAQAVEFSQIVTADFAAQNKGRSVTSDSSVLINVWYTGTDENPAVGVSNNTALLLYSDKIAGTATTVNTTSTSYDTVGELVDYINSVDGFNASVGNDAYRAMSSAYMLGENLAAPGDREGSAYTVNLDCSTATFMSCGVLSSVGKTGRIKSFETSLASNSDNMTISIYEGDTAVYTKYVPAGAYNSTTAYGSSISSVKFTDDGSKGLAGTKNTPLCLVIDSDGALDTNAVAKAQNNITIIYDKLAE